MAAPLNEEEIRRLFKITSRLLKHMLAGLARAEAEAFYGLDKGKKK